MIVKFATLAKRLKFDHKSVVFGDFGSLQGVKGQFRIVDTNLNRINKISYSYKFISVLSDIPGNIYNKALLLPHSHDPLDLYFNRLVDCKNFLKMKGNCFLVSRLKEGAKRYRDFMEYIFGNVSVLSKDKGDWILKSTKIDNNPVEKRNIENKISVKLRDKDYQFYTGKGLFSFNEIDKGTLFLIENIDSFSSPGGGGVCLDFGCGYGPIGIAFSHYFDRVEMVDADVRVLELCKRNIELNGVKNATVALSDCLIDYPCKEKFSVVLSNPPTHIGVDSLKLFLDIAWELLTDTGAVFIIINRILNYKNLYEKFKKNEILEINNQYKIVKLSK